MAFSLKARIQESNTSVKNNDAIVRFQAETIGKLEKQFAAGEIDRAEYVRQYAHYSEIIRSMGR